MGLGDRFMECSPAGHVGIPSGAHVSTSFSFRRREDADVSDGIVFCGCLNFIGAVQQSCLVGSRTEIPRENNKETSQRSNGKGAPFSNMQNNRQFPFDFFLALAVGTAVSGERVEFPCP